MQTLLRGEGDKGTGERKAVVYAIAQAFNTPEQRCLYRYWSRRYQCRNVEKRGWQVQAIGMNSRHTVQPESLPGRIRRPMSSAANTPTVWKTKAVFDCKDHLTGPWKGDKPTAPGVVHGKS